MDNCSYFFENKAIFGSYPTQENIKILEKEGVRVFLNLTHSSESKITPYDTKYMYISYPILDHNVPTNIKHFCRLIYKICEVILNLKQEEKIYIHCKGGHGRSGLVVACLTCKLLDMQPTQALEYTKFCHNKRTVMRQLWRNIGSPQTPLQKKFVQTMCEDIVMDSNHELSVDFKRNVEISNVGSFGTMRLAINQMVSGGMTTEDATVMALQCKFETNKELKILLANTGLRNITTQNKEQVDLMFIKILNKMRYNYILEDSM